MTSCSARLKTMSDNDGWITAEELADFLKTPVASIWRLSRSGQIPSYRLGRLMRFDLDEVRAALKSPDQAGAGTEETADQ
jgi:excisionase family DNA binding protein